MATEKSPPLIQQAIRDIRYISETQRAAQQDDLVCRSIRMTTTRDVSRLGPRRLEIHRPGHRSILSDRFHLPDDHRHVPNAPLRSVHLQQSRADRTLSLASLQLAIHLIVRSFRFFE